MKAHLIDYCHTNSFFSLLQDTKKYHELYSSKEARTSLLLSLLFILIITFLQDELSNCAVRNIIQSVLSMLIPGLIGLLGFLVTGLAMTASIIKFDVIQRIDKVGKSGRLVEILFSFYFEGAMVGINIIVLLFSYFMLYYPIHINFGLLVVVEFICIYFFLFSIIYAVTLLGTCINFFIVNVFYSEICEDSRTIPDQVVKDKTEIKGR